MHLVYRLHLLYRNGFGKSTRENTQRKRYRCEASGFLQMRTSSPYKEAGLSEGLLSDPEASAGCCLEPRDCASARKQTRDGANLGRNRRHDKNINYLIRQKSWSLV